VWPIREHAAIRRHPLTLPTDANSLTRCLIFLIFDMLNVPARQQCPCVDVAHEELLLENLAHEELSFRNSGSPVTLSDAGRTRTLWALICY
jgi:hypothetical protein